MGKRDAESVYLCIDELLQAGDFSFRETFHSLDLCFLERSTRIVWTEAARYQMGV
jgi:hypothetical protein